MRFKSEEERTAAMQALDTAGVDAEAKLSEIVSAEIGEEPEVKSEGEAPVETVEGKPENSPAEYKIDDLKGYKTPEELLKAFDNAQELINRQAEKLRVLDQPRVDPELQMRLDKAEKELAEIKAKGGIQQAAEGAADLNALDAERQKIDSLLDELDAQAAADPDIAFTADYQKKLRDANRMSTKNMAGYQKAIALVHSDLAEMRKQQKDSVDTRERIESENRQRQADEAQDKEFDLLDDPEYKTTTPTKELRQKYFNWQHEVCTAFYGRPAKTQDEITFAMTQLQMGNPKLLQECQIRKVSTTPDEELTRYLKKSEANLYRQGYRKNAAGQFTRENRIMIPGQDGKLIPYVMPSLKEAIDDMKLKSGEFQRREGDAYTAGARDFARAAERRDPNLLSDRDGGGGSKDVTWAIKFLGGLDELAIADAISRGNKQVLVEVNEARKLLGQEPLTL